MTIRLRKEYESGQLLSKNPIVCVVENFITQEEIDHLIEAAKPQLKKALVAADKAGVESEGRTGQNCWIRHSQTKVIEALALRVSRLVGLSLSQAENYQVIY